MRALLVACLVGCGHEALPAEDLTPDPFETSHGIRVYPQGHHTSPTQVERAVDFVLAELSAMDPEKYSLTKIEEMFSRYRRLAVRVEDDYLDCTHGIFNKCYGTHNHGSIRYRYEPCLGDTALQHELLHMFGGLLADNPDGDHEASMFWEERDGNRSIEARGAKDLISRYCY